MKISERMRFPHPVLSEYCSDYVSGKFSASFTYKETDDMKLNLVSNFEIDSNELVTLIQEQKVATGYFIVCRPTYFNSLQRAGLGTTESYFDLSMLYGNITLRPVIWSLKEINGFNSPVINEEFGEKTIFRKGTIVGMGPEFKFSIDPRKFKPFESIFSLAEDDSIKKGMMEVDADQDKITILAHTSTKRAISAMRNTSVGRSVMITSVYMPAIAEVVTRIRSGEKNLEARRWYKVFTAKCTDLGIDLANESDSPLKIAQILLKEPLIRTIDALEMTN